MTKETLRHGPNFHGPDIGGPSQLDRRHSWMEFQDFLLRREALLELLANSSIFVFAIKMYYLFENKLIYTFHASDDASYNTIKYSLRPNIV